MLIKRLGLTEHMLFTLALTASLMGLYVAPSIIDGFISLVLLPWSLGRMYLRLTTRPFRPQLPAVLMGAALALYALAAVLHRGGSWAGVREIWIIAMYIFNAGDVPDEMDARQIRSELTGMSTLFLVCLLPLSLMTLYAIFSGELVYFLGREIGVLYEGAIDMQIRIFSHQNVTGRVLIYCILFCIYAVSACRRRLPRLVFGAALIPFTLTLAHTQSRACFIALGAALGAMVFRFVWLKLPVRRRLVSAAAGLAAAAAAMLAVIYGLNLIVSVDLRIALKTSGLEALHTGGATRAETEGAFNVLSTGRDILWRLVWDFLKANPRYLIVGMGPGDIITAMAETVPEITFYAHLHNSFLESLVRGGLPYLLCVLAFLCTMVGPAVRVLLAPATEENRGLFVMPMLVGALLMICLMESILFCETRMGNMMFFFGCGWLMRSERLRRRGR